MPEKLDSRHELKKIWLRHFPYEPPNQDKIPDERRNRSQDGKIGLREKNDVYEE